MSLPKHRLLFECLFLFLIIPTLLHLLPFARGIFIFLWMGAVCCYLILKNDGAFDRKQYWHKEAVTWPHLKPVLIRFVISAILLMVGVYLFEPERLFEFPKERLKLWMMVMVFYPLFSVYPQEIIFRAFFLHRYRHLFASRNMMFAANAIAFGYAHILFNHWLAMALSTIGGWIFAHTYYKHRSLALVCIEHALYGCWIFTVGLGWYFYSGAVR